MFLRNIILARILSKSDFGIAATLAMVVSIFELAGRMSFGQQIVQYAKTNLSDFQHALQASQALCGCFSALLLLLFAYFIPQFIGMETNCVSFILLSIIPLCAAFCNLDIARQQRDLSFKPITLVETIPQIITTIIVWPLAEWFGDFRAILSILLIKALSSCLISHLLAQNRLKFYWKKDLILESFRFGWPLLATSFLMFATTQSDRILIASCYSMSDLGIYAVASTLTSAFGLALFKISGPMMLPVLSRFQHDDPAFMEYYHLYTQVLALCGSLFIVFMIFDGVFLIELLFGKKYLLSTSLTVCLACGQAFRILSGAPTCGAMAKGDTINSLYSQLSRIIGIFIMVPVVFLKLDLYWIAAASGIGEMSALMVSLICLKTRHKIDLHLGIYPACILMFVTIISLALKYIITLDGILNNMLITATSILFVLIIFCTTFSNLRKTLFTFSNTAIYYLLALLK